MKNRIYKLKLTKSFYYTFFLLFGIVFLIFLAFAAYTRYSAQKALQHELLSYSEIQTKSVGDTVDNYMLDLRFIMATLSNLESTKAFFNLENPNFIYESNNRIVTEQLLSYQNSISHIDSIYLYSPASNNIISSSKIVDAYYAEDTNWLEYIDDASNQSYLLFTRKKHNKYPYLLCLLKSFETNQGLAAVSINIDLSKMNPFPSYMDNFSEQLYIISDDGEILYRYNQREYLEPYTVISELVHFSSDKSAKQHFVNGSNPYIYTQYHSGSYPWSYILITNVTDYTASISGSQSYVFTLLIFGFLIALLLIFMIVFRASKPINAIIRLLENPENFTYQDINDKENRAIIQKILTYIQSNSTLSEELEKQLSLLHNAKMLALQSQINPHFLMNTLNMIRTSEIDELGYEHKVPNMTLMLSRLLQYALSSEDTVSLNTEIYYAEQFVRLMSERYTHSIQFFFHIETDIENIIVPKLIIQPLVENAVFHGLSAVPNKERSLTVSVSVSDKVCCLAVSDNGAGMNNEKLSSLLSQVSNYAETPSNSIGLHNVLLRMHLLYGESFSFNINSKENEGTCVTLMFPLILS